MAYYDSYIRCKLNSLKRTPPVFNGGIFNGLEYQVVTNPITGRQWLDRNLGATRVATAVNDSQAYGWLFQWGRLADGHQLRESPTRNVQSTGDVPGHQDFIIGFSDWRNPSNDNLWQGVDTINSIAPSGWRLPTLAEFQEEASTWATQDSTGAYNSGRKFPVNGGRRETTGALLLVGTSVFLWTMTTLGNNSYHTNIITSEGYLSYPRGRGCGIRLIKNI